MVEVAVGADLKSSAEVHAVVIISTICRYVADLILNPGVTRCDRDARHRLFSVSRGVHGRAH